MRKRGRSLRRAMDKFFAGFLLSRRGFHPPQAPRRPPFEAHQERWQRRAAPASTTAGKRLPLATSSAGATRQLAPPVAPVSRRRPYKWPGHTTRPVHTTSVQRSCRRAPPTSQMSLRTRTDRLLEEVGVERTATLNSDVHALAEAVGLDFTSLPATLTALEAEFLGAPAPAAPPVQPAEPAAAPAPAEPAADSDSDGFELTGSQTEAERTAAARRRRTQNASSM